VSTKSVPTYTSPNDPNPFNPNASSSGSGSGPSIPSNANVPELAMVVTAPPDFAPDTAAGSGSSSSSSSPPAVVDDFAIDLAGLRGAESSLIDASTSIVDAYEFLKALFESNKDTVFGQQATITGMEHTGNGDGDGDGANAEANGDSAPGSIPVTNADPIQKSAQSFADGSNGQPGMNDVEAYVLQQVGNAMGLLGQFLAMMNGAGFSYAQADASSLLPEVGGGVNNAAPPSTNPAGGLDGTMTSTQTGSST
jgi:hypothetical protein